MNILDHIWPWSRFHDLECDIAAYQETCRDLRNELSDAHRTSVRHAVQSRLYRDDNELLAQEKADLRDSNTRLSDALAAAKAREEAAAAKRSDIVSRGNRTRYAKRRAA